jgi:hypothetical protein
MATFPPGEWPYVDKNSVGQAMSVMFLMASTKISWRWK